MDTNDTAPTTRSIAENVGPATVRVGRHGGRGVGVVIAEGLVVTNAHNLRGPTVTVTFADGRVASGEVRGVDGEGDLAAVAVDTTGAVAIAWSDVEAQLGDPVWTVSPAPGGGLRVTSGAVSSVNRPFRGPGGRRIAGNIEHTAPLARGSSGGPLLDAQGQLIGLNTHRLGEGFYLALPVNAELRARIEGLGAGQSPLRRRLGVALVPAQATRRLREVVGLDAREGLLVRHVEAEGPAERAGVRRGDLIVAVDGAAIAEPDDLFAALSLAGPSLQLTVVRGTEEHVLDVSFAAAAEGTQGGTSA
jgi:serine protease Do